MTIPEILYSFRGYFILLVISSAVYCVALYLVRRKWPEFYKISETLIVTIWVAYTMFFISFLVSPDAWIKTAISFTVSAIPILLFSWASWAKYLQDIYDSIRNHNANKEE